MSLLQSVQTGRSILPPRICVYGDNKIGKTTFAAGAPDPILIQTERGADAIGVARFPLAQSYGDVLDQLKALATEDHQYRTVIVDSLDTLQTLLEGRVKQLLSIDSMEQVGYGKAYKRLEEEFHGLLDSLDYLNAERGMGVIVIAHAEIKTYAAPDSDSYDRYQPKGDKRIVPLVLDWADVIGFCSYETFLKSEDTGFGQTRSRAIGTGNRVMHLEERPAYKAGNRYSLPESIPLSWSAFAEAFAAATRHE